MGTSTRNSRVDSLRGIAALMVAGTHAMLVQEVGGIRNIWQHTILESLAGEAKIIQILYSLFNGNFAVMIFMVMSGWALSYSWLRKEPQLEQYFRKRILRIVPVYWISTTLLLILMYIGSVPTSMENSSLWWEMWLREKLSGEMIVRHLLFLSPGLGGSSWTLQPIVVGSLVFPFLYKWFSDGTRVKKLILLLVNLLLIAWITHKDLYILLAAMVAGISLGMSDSIKWLQGVRKIFIPTVFSVGVITRAIWQSRLVWIIEGIAAYLLLSNVISLKTEFMPKYNWIVGVGRISYSFYLWHFVVLYLMTPVVLRALGGNYIGIVINGLISILVTLPVAWISYQIIERDYTKTSF